MMKLFIMIFSEADAIIPGALNPHYGLVHVRFIAIGF